MKSIELTPKQRLLAAITGKEIDYVPWSPFLAYYWDFLDENIQNAGMVKYCEDMGATPLMRGTSVLHTLHWKNCEIRQEMRNGKQLTVYETPVGNLTEVRTYSESANSWFLTGHPIHEEEDFKTLMYLYEHLEFSDNLKEFEKEYTELGDRGLILPVIGTDLKTSFQSLVEHWCGTESLAYAICDYPELVEECLHTMWEKDKKTLEIALKSPAEGFIFWEDSSTTNISPDYFRNYTMPEICEWGNLLHKNNRLLVHHACGHLKDLLPLISETPIDALESISPPPTGNITAEEIRDILPERIALIGGIEPTFFLNSTMEELLNHTEKLLKKMKGSRFVLANSDSCPPGVAYEKFLSISRMVKNQL